MRKKHKHLQTFITNLQSSYDYFYSNSKMVITQIKYLKMIGLWLFLAICLLANSSRLSLNHYENLLSTTQLDKLRGAQLQKHNEFRSRHGCPVLSLSKKINAIAQNYSQYLGSRINKSAKLVHSGSKIYGENLYWGWGSPKLNYTAGTASISWYSQQSIYKYGVFPATLGTGHFTAMIWREVTQVGFGFFKVKDNGGEAIYVVANYSPTPNIQSAQLYAKNVPKPKPNSKPK